MISVRRRISHDTSRVFDTSHWLIQADRSKEEGCFNVVYIPLQLHAGKWHHPSWDDPHLPLPLTQSTDVLDVY